jgi:hypothetical protein
MPFRHITCAHCIRVVSVTSDNICPACGGNTVAGNAEAEGLTLVEFVDGEKLPRVCVLCGCVAEHSVVVGERNEQPSRDKGFWLSRMLGALGGAHWFELKPQETVKEYRISVTLPVCARHRESRYLKPTYADYERYRLTVPAHRSFIEQWKRTAAGGSS